ncbi:Uncharacterised protein [Mycobacteroides abscessus subsp. abscessus]|nr:Uncharacterised protein [Mycobacteroides abscessus subsp. abscessus]
MLGLLDIAADTDAMLAEIQPFCNSASKNHADLVKQLTAGGQMKLLWYGCNISERLSTWYDCCFSY